MAHRPLSKTLAASVAALIASGGLVAAAQTAADAASALPAASSVRSPAGSTVLRFDLTTFAAAASAYSVSGSGTSSPRLDRKLKPVPSPTATPPPTSTTSATKTLFGTSIYTGDGSTYAQAVQRQSTKYGKLEMVRTFYPGLPDAWPGKAALSGGPVSVSFKGSAADIAAGKLDAFFTTWFAAAPRDRLVYWTYYHEPEDNIESGSMTYDQYKAAYRRLDALADKANNPRLKTTTIWMCYTLRAGSGRDWRNYYPGSGVVDVMGWDCYNHLVDKGQYVAASTMLGGIVSVATSQNKPWGLGETGSPLITGDTGAQRAAWVKSLATYAQANGAQFVAYYDAKHANNAGVMKDYQLMDTSGIAAWKWAVNSL